MKPHAPVGLGEVITQAVAQVPERPALATGDEWWTYASLDEGAQRWEAALTQHGVCPGDRVALLGQTSPALVAALIGTARAGGVGALLNPRLQSGELGVLCELASLRTGIVLPGAGSQRGQHFATALVSDDGMPPQPTAHDAHAPRDGGAERDRLPHDLGSGQEPALVLFSSGTTGRPKPVEISHASITDRWSYYGTSVDPSTGPVVDMMCVPLFHIGGALGLLIAMHSARSVVLLPRFDAGEWLRLVETHRVRQTFVVPTMLRRILDHPDFGVRDLSSLRALSYGAAPAGSELVRRAREQLSHVAMTNVFGQTETLGAYAALSAEDHRRGYKLDSVGRAFPGVEVRVVDPATRAELDDGMVGEAVVRAPHHVTSDWLRTGDLVARDEEGYLFVRGRLKDTINRGGEKFAPAEVEEAIRLLPEVLDVAVAGVPDEELGERVGALVVSDQPLSAQKIRDHCAEILARFKVPEIVRQVDELPYTELGKLPRSAVVAAITERS